MSQTQGCGRSKAYLTSIVQVKADRHEYKDSKDSIKELEKQTAKAAEEEFKRNKGQ